MKAPTELASGPVSFEELDGGALWHLRLDAPKANVLDAAMIAALTDAFRRARQTPTLKAVLLDSGGPHFSFGASVEEHLPGHFEEMLQSFHALFDTILDAAVPVVAVVRGQCLGGGLELAAFAHRVVCAPDAVLGQPEIVLGVFAPVASVFLTERVGRGAAEDLCLTGRSVPATEALAMGLVDQVADDPAQAARDWAREHFLPKSASSLRSAVRAVRAGLADRFARELARVEELYAEELMKSHDAVEGLEAFLAKRSPAWRNE